MEQNFEDYVSAADALPGTKEGSEIRAIYTRLAAGHVLTSLDAVFANHTVYLGKYISLLRNKYNIPVADKWIQVSKRKRVKQYFIVRNVPGVAR